MQVEQHICFFHHRFLSVLMFQGSGGIVYECPLRGRVAFHYMCAMVTLSTVPCLNSAYSQDRFLWALGSILGTLAPQCSAYLALNLYLSLISSQKCTCPGPAHFRLTTEATFSRPLLSVGNYVKATQPQGWPTTSKIHPAFLSDCD